MIADGLSPIQQAIRDQFSEGSPASEWFVVLITLAGLAALGGVFYLRSLQTTNPEPLNNPHELFFDLLAKLKLTPKQQNFLRLAAKASRLQHPTMMLLSPVVYDRHVTSWSMSHRYEGTRDDRSDLSLAAEIRNRLFPGSSFQLPLGEGLSGASGKGSGRSAKPLPV